jgi:hypothetical protein
MFKIFISSTTEKKKRWFPFLCVLFFNNKYNSHVLSSNNKYNSLSERKNPGNLWYEPTKRFESVEPWLWIFFNRSAACRVLPFIKKAKLRTHKRELSFSSRLSAIKRWVILFSCYISLSQLCAQILRTASKKKKRKLWKYSKLSEPDQQTFSITFRR